MCIRDRLCSISQVLSRYLEAPEKVTKISRLNGMREGKTPKMKPTSQNSNRHGKAKIAMCTWNLKATREIRCL